MNIMKKSYCELYSKFEDTHQLEKLSHFVAMQGSDYALQNTRLMVIGRATNGWKRLDCSSKESFGEAADKAFTNVGFNWIIKGEKGFENGDGYYLNRSAFWRTIRSICVEMLGEQLKERWFESIVWSNICKIAPPDTGEKGKSLNPDNALCKKQISVCREILRKEIETLKPTHILFVTGYDWWFFDKKDVYGVSDLFKEPTFCENKYVNGTARYVSDMLNIPVVVASRPERKNEAEYVSTVVKVMKE